MTSSTTKTETNSSLAQKRALLAARLQKAAHEPRQAPLSFAQQRLWFLDQLEPNSPLYNIGSVAKIKGTVDSNCLEESLKLIVARHETLRTRFGFSEETPVQIVDSKGTFHLELSELSHIPEAAREDEARRLVQVELNRPFDLTSEHPMRACLVRFGAQEHRLILVLHHIIADEWSLKVLFNELAILYTGLVTGVKAALPDLPMQYSDYGRWQRQWLQGERLQEQLRYWTEHLKDYPPITELPPNHPRGGVPSFRGNTLSRTFRSGLADALKDVARKSEATLFMVLLAAFKTLVFRYTQQDDLIICSPVAGRNRLETESLIGFFVNTLALRTNLKGDPRFDELLTRVRQVTLGAMAHQDLPFERVVEELEPERSLTHLPFTKLMFSFQTGFPDHLELPGARLEFIEVESDLAKFDITVVFRDASHGLSSSIEYNCDLFDAQTIERLLGHLEVLLEGIVATPQAKLSELPLLGRDEERQLLIEWNDTARVFPRDCCTHELFEAQAAATPDATAVVWGRQRMSYSELNSRANQLARYLKQFDIKPDVPVGLCMTRCPEMLVGMLGILKSGGAYVPLDANYPKERLAFMLEDVAAPVILTQQRLLSRVPRDHGKVVCLDADWELVAREPRENTSSLANARSLAYVMYTSGSTGRPKGVAVPHLGINRLVINNDFIELDASDRIAQVSNISFDAATFEIWGALLNGAQLVGITRDVALSPTDFAAELREQGITAMFLTSALFNQLASEAPGAFETLRTVIAGGEALDPKWVRAVLGDRPPKRLVNGYGPTENTTFTCCHEISQLPNNVSNVPIGKPISNTTVYILDRNLKPVPIGVPGELYTGGDGLARGYWRRPELTAERFVANPFDPERSSYLYKTGDLARFLQGGVIEFLGRIDDQVKIRGFRIEPGEIEALLSKHSGVRECAVKVCGNGPGEKRLVAYVAPNAEPGPNASELRSFLMNELPDYMIPSAFVPIEALPLTPNGKVDRKSLPEPDQSRPSLDKQYVSARDAIETQLVSIWESVLAVRPIGIQDKFFDLGGHSMLAVRVIAQIERAFGRKLRLATLFQAPTIERLARVLRGELKETAVTSGTALVEIQSVGSRPPLFLVHGAGGGMFWGYINLARELGNDQPVYGFKSRGLDGQTEFATITEMAARYVADLRKLQPHGPYYIGGYCFGGNVAYEMACQLAEQGEKVALLALLNCAPPHSSYSKIPWTPRWWLRFARNLVYWGNYFGHWSGTQRREFFRWKWQLLRKRLSRGHRSFNRDLSTLDPGDLVDLSSCTADQKKTWEAHIRALVSFRPRPYPGCVHLFRSPGHPLWCSFDENYGWGDLARNGVQVATVPGAHEKILEEPWVKELAKRFSDALNQAQEASKGEATEPRQVERNDSVNGPTTASRAEASCGSAKPSDAIVADQQLKALEYWKQQLGTLPDLLELPADRPRPAQNAGATASHPLTLSRELGERMQRFAEEQACEVSDVLLAALAVVLERYTASRQFVIGTTMPLKKTNSVQLVPLCCDLSGDPSLGDLSRRVHQTQREALEHLSVTFGDIVAAVRPDPSASYSPVVQIVCSVTESLDSTCGDGAAFDPQINKCDLVMRVCRAAEGLVGSLRYNAALFDQSRIERLTQHLETVLGTGLDKPHAPVSQLDLLPKRERETLLRDWNETETVYPRDKTLAVLFREQALRTPHAVALVCGETRLTYLELHDYAEKVAGQLAKLGVGRESLVAICLERSVEMVAAMLGTLLAGAAYVPLDPKYPKDRLAFTLQDAKAKVLITNTRLLESLGQLDSQVLELNSVHELVSCALTGQEALARPEDLAYVIYTSGSTGKPKGVALEHRNAVEMVSWAKDTFSPEELSGVLFSTSICFDLSVFELFVPLCWGGKVILADNALALAELAAASEVRMINTVPSAIRELLRLRAVPTTIKVINLAGEPLATELVDQIYRETSVAKVYDFYGPTETTTYSTGGLRRAGQPASIGRPLSNEQVYIVDASLRLVPIGNPGELLIGGDGLARSYLHRPELTAEKFISNPFKPGTRLYRTGDLARWREDGTLEYLGRMDHQVKIRGFRIELGEIESVIKSHPGVASTVVVAREDEPGDKRLVGYVVARPETSLAAEDIKLAIRAQLPEFMVPSDFVFLESMPLTPNGKIDRKALPAPTVRSEVLRKDLVAPGNPVEEQLVKIWSEVLHLKEVSVQDNFFDLGGHSLLAVRVLAAIRDTFRVELPISAIFGNATICELARSVSDSLQRNGQTASEDINPVSRAEILPLSYVQERLWFLHQLDPGSPAYNVATALRLKGGLNEVALKAAVNAIVARHESLRSCYEYAEDRLVHKIKSSLEIEIQRVELPTQSSEELTSQTRQVIDEHARRTFDLANGPLIRATLFRFSEVDHALLVVMHHSVSDGWSLAIFFEELASLYEAGVAGRAVIAAEPLQIQYADFAAWQRHQMGGVALTAEMEHWKAALSGAPGEIALPLDHPRPESPSGQAETTAVLMEGVAVQKLTEFAHQHGCTPFMVFLTGLVITLQKWTGQEDLVVGTVVAGRTRREIEKLIGCFMNFLPLRARVADARTAQETLTDVRTVVLEAQGHQECPFEKIVEAINPRRRRDQNPLYNVALLLQNFPANPFDTKLLQASSIPVSIGAALLDLRFEIEQAQGALSMTCEYKRDLFERETVQHLITSWREAVEVLVEAPQTRIAEFQLAAGLRHKAPRIEAHESRVEKMVVSATFTAEPVNEALRYWLDRLQLQTDVEFAPYNQVFQQLLDPGSAIGRNKQGTNVLLVRLEDWQRQEEGVASSPAATAAMVERNVADFIAALKTAASRGSVPFLVCLCPGTPDTLADPEIAGAFRRIQHSTETQLAALPSVHVLTAEELGRWYPVKDYYDAAGEQLGHVPYTPAFFTSLGTGLVRKYHALKRAAYKVIALDCDNTLWRGVCGEEGPAGIELDAARRALQEFMVQQRDYGMLLCLCSKNNEADVQAVFAQRADFPLQMKHIAASRLNWLAKSANLKAMAQELNLGLDSFIFIDDNPVECAEVQASCPEVLTLQLPEDPAQIPHFLGHCWAFDHLRITSEDRKRAELYQQNRQREELRSQAPTMEDFLAGLELKVTIGPIAPEHWTRVSQLTQRTNQFNFTTRRMTEQELAHFLSSGQVLIVEVSDRFGNYGLVGAVFFHIAADTLFVDNLLLSCRVLSRGIEHQMIARLGRLARELNLNRVDAKFVPSEKNLPALNFLDQCCGHYKQPLNGGSVYRMPVGFAAEMAFHPEESQQTKGAALLELSRVRTPATRSRFALCNTIAIEAGDLGRIQEQIQKPLSTRARTSGGYTAPRTDLERQLCALWQDLLRVESVGVTDDFFELGGHSLLAVRLFAEVEKLVGRKFPLVTLFQAPTISRLAKVISQDGGAGSLLVPIQPKGDKPPLFLVHGAGGDVLWGYANLAAHLPPDQPIYGIRSHGQQGGQEKTHLEEMALSYLDVVRARQPEGPYHLGGYCFGGNVAYEMARQLRLQGQEVALVVLLDSAPANAGYETVAWWRVTFPWRFLRNVNFWLDDFFGLESVDRRRFVGRKIRAVGRKLKKRLGLGKGMDERFNVEEVIDPRHFPENELKLWQTHLEALIAHVERPYSGRVALLRTRGQPLFCSLQEDFCWGKLVKGRFTMRCIPGSHENIFMEPNVRVLASELAQLLKETNLATSSASGQAIPVSATDGVNQT